MSGEKYFDVLIIAPLEEEAAAIFRHFQPIEDLSKNNHLIYSVDPAVEGCTALMVQLPEWGRSQAASTVAYICTQFKFGLISCVGIAGSLSNDVGIGDVVYTGTVIDVHDKSKVEDIAPHNLAVKFAPKFHHTPIELTCALNFLRTNPSINDAHNQWSIRQKDAHQLLVDEANIGEDVLRARRPMSKFGSLVCGAVSTSKKYNDALASIDRHVLAIETESGGVFEQAATYSIPALSIRGISDLANSEKTATEKQSLGINRRIAADNAVSFLHHQMQNPYLIDYLSKQRYSHQQGTFNLQTNKLEDPVGVAVAEALRDIDDNLRELSQEYRMMPKGYRLPIPRIRASGVDNAEAQDDPCEVRDAIKENRSLTLSLPRNYPDSSLPWALANSLIIDEIDGKPLVPIVIDGAEITHKFSLEKVSSSYFKTGKHEAAQRVFIVADPPLASKTRRARLLSEMDANRDARFIIITRSEIELLDQSGIASQPRSSLYEVCDISFVELTAFIRRTFEMSEAEAEVVALRLHNTFRRFSLSAYPTYFAGIPKETLVALLQANRRSELIQLAVDGSLTFLVADDAANVTLSRTTRSRFLRQLAAALSVEKQSFNQSDLVQFARDFAEKYDFAIDPLEFINAFREKGILHFEEGQVRFSLPFIQSYLLAEELIDNPDLARRYFSASDNDFDLATFDLYAEIGADSKVVQMLTKRIKESIEELKRDGVAHTMLSNSLRPSIMNRLDKLEKAHQGLRKALSEIRAKTADGKRKQETLDIQDRLRDEAAKRGKQARPQRKGSSGEDRIQHAGMSWTIGVYLLGSGAEHLVADVKQALASDLITLGSAIVDQWTEFNTGFDFEAFREASHADLDAILAQKIDDENERNLLITGLFDGLEFELLGGPFRRVMHYLCENARSKVLGLSVERATSEGTINELMHSLWLSDIDSNKGVAKFRRALKKTPASPFLRLTMATHIFGRVYWAHSNSKDRDRLLDAAAEAIKGTKLSFDRRKVVRQIEGRTKKRR